MMENATMTGERTTMTGEQGVFVHTTEKSSGGRKLFQPGQSGNPGGKRKPKTDYMRSVLDLLVQEFPAQFIVDGLLLAEQYAKDYKSWRGLIEIRTFLLDRTMGKPARQQMGDTSQYDMMQETMLAAYTEALRNQLGPVAEQPAEQT